MKAKKQQKGKRRRAGQAVRGGTTRLSSLVLSPSSTTSGNGEGVLRPEEKEFRLPEDLIETSESERHNLMPGGVVLTILGLAIVYIIIITWFVSKMPDK